MVAGFIVNRFRGDPSLFDAGMRIIAEHTGWAGARPRAVLRPTRAACPPRMRWRSTGASRPPRPAVVIAVPVLPRISNFDDLDPLKAEPGVRLVFVRRGEAIPGDADLVILPGSKATIADLAALRAEGWDIDIAAHVRRGGRVLGLCGGYQMLGTRDRRSRGHGGSARRTRRAGASRRRDHADARRRRLEAVTGTSLADGAPFAGYEMHVGETTGADLRAPRAALRRRTDRRRVVAGRPGARRLRPRPFRRRPPARRMAALDGGRSLRLRATRRMSRTRWTRSPRIWKRMSIATGCSASRADEQDRRRQPARRAGSRRHSR